MITLGKSVEKFQQLNNKVLLINNKYLVSFGVSNKSDGANALEIQKLLVTSQKVKMFYPKRPSLNLCVQVDRNL